MAHKKHKKAARKGTIPLGASPVTLAFAVDVAEYLAGLREAVDAARDFAAANRALIAAMEDETAQLRASASQRCDGAKIAVDLSGPREAYDSRQAQSLRRSREALRREGGTFPVPADDAPETPGD